MAGRPNPYRTPPGAAPGPPVPPLLNRSTETSRTAGARVWRSLPACSEGRRRRFWESSAAPRAPQAGQTMPRTPRGAVPGPPAPPLLNRSTETSQAAGARVWRSLPACSEGRRRRFWESSAAPRAPQAGQTLRAPRRTRLTAATPPPSSRSTCPALADETPPCAPAAAPRPAPPAHTPRARSSRTPRGSCGR